MHIAEQNTRLKLAIVKIKAEMITLELALLRKTGSPYPDGTTDNLVNVDSDVYPTLQRVRADIQTLLGEVDPETTWLHHQRSNLNRMTP